MDRREHAGGAPKAERSGDQWVQTCEFPYEVLDDFSHEEEQLYPMEKFTEALHKITMWIVNDGRFQERGVTDRAMVFAWMLAPDALGCATQAELADRMNLSRSQVNEYVRSFTSTFSYVCGATYTPRQTRSRKQ